MQPALQTKNDGCHERKILYSIKLIFILIEPFILQKLKRELKYL